MLIQPITNQFNYKNYKQQTIPKYTINFKSNRERERELERLRALQREREKFLQEERLKEELLQKRRTEIIEELKKEMHVYPEVDNVMSTKMAGFLSQFTCAIQNNSEHDIREFFGDEATAKELREKLSPACQHDSLELRKEIQKIDEAKDPIMMLIAANKMKRFMPKAGLLTPKQQEELLQGLKDVITMAVQNVDMSRFEEDDKYAIGEMVQMIKASETTDFGISVKLKALIDKLNKKKLNLGFIPPVQVRELETMAKKAKI